MVIRREQIEEFERTVRESIRRTFENRVLADVRRIYPEQVWQLSDKVLLGRIRRDTERSIAYGVSIEGDVARFICFTFDCGENFDSEPWAHEILADTCLSGSGKVSAIADRLESLDELEGPH